MRLDYKWRAAIVVAIGLFMAVLDITIVSVALPQMQAVLPYRPRYHYLGRDCLPPGAGRGDTDHWLH